MRTHVGRMGLLAAVALLVASCGGDDDATSSTARSGGETTAPSGGETSEPAPAGSAACAAEHVGGELDAIANIEPFGWDPTYGASVAAYGGIGRISVFDSLMRFDHATGEYEPQLAESLEPNDDLTEWTLTLRDGAEFANGNPVTTAAVELSFERHADPSGVSLWRSAVQQIEQMEIIDEWTMVFHLTNPFALFPNLLAGSPGMIYDPIEFEEIGAEAFGANPGTATAGPFVVDYYLSGEPMVLVRNENYWGGQVCLDQITLTVVFDEAARIDSLELGEAAIATVLTLSDIADLRDEGFLAPPNIVSGTDTILLNHGAGWATEDIRVRRAIAHAIDPTLIDQRLTDGRGSPSNTILSPLSRLYTDDMVGLEHDTELAAQLVEQAKADGFDGKLTFVCHSAPRYQELAIAIKAQLDDVGFDVELDNNMQIGDSVGRFYAGDFELTCGSNNLEDTQPWVALMDRVGPIPSVLARTGIDSPAIDAGLDQLRDARTLEEQQAAMVTLQDVFNQEVPQVNAVHGEFTSIYNPDIVQGVVGSDSGNLLLAHAYLVSNG